jgi:hypothetical protein
VRWSSGPRHRRNRASTPPPVICSAASIGRRRCVPALLNPLVTSAGASPTDPCIPETSRPPAAPSPVSAAALAARSSSTSTLRCVFDPHDAPVSNTSTPCSFCARPRGLWQAVAPGTPLAGDSHRLSPSRAKPEPL